MTDVEASLSNIRGALEDQAATLQQAINALTLSPEQYSQLYELIESADMPVNQLERLGVILDEQVQHMRFAMTALAVPSEQFERLRNLVRSKDQV
jgi:hypothetical protein